MVFTPNRQPLGGLDAQCWARDPATFGTTGHRNRRPVAAKESAKWLRSYQSIPTLLPPIWSPSKKQFQLAYSLPFVLGNPLMEAKSADGWKKCIDAAPLFGCDLVCGFAGRVVDKPIPDSMKQFKKVFGPLVKRAADKGVRIAFENCDMGGDWSRGDWSRGDWNIATAPTAWEMMFHEIPAQNLGLEWEPCHQMVSLIDPLPQLKQWVHKIFHLHGKDATIDWTQLRTTGLRGGQPFV